MAGEVLVSPCCHSEVTVWGLVDMAYHGAQVVVGEDGEPEVDYDSVYDTTVGDGSHADGDSFNCSACSADLSLDQLVREDGAP